MVVSQLIVISRRKGAAQKMFFMEYHTALTEVGVESGKFAHSDSGMAIQRNLLMKEAGGLGDSVEETKELIVAEARRRKKAESMYMDAYAFYHEHIEGLQDHVIAIGTGHGDEHGEGGGEHGGGGHH